MSGHGEKFGRKKESAIGALLACATLTEAAASCGVGDSTLRRWLHDEGFAQREAKTGYSVTIHAESMKPELRAS
jgi:hypothetical protein